MPCVKATLATLLQITKTTPRLPSNLSVVSDTFREGGVAILTDPFFNAILRQLKAHLLGPVGLNIGSMSLTK